MPYISWKYADPCVCADEKGQLGREELLSMVFPYTIYAGRSNNLKLTETRPIDCWSADGRIFLRRFGDACEIARVLCLQSAEDVLQCIEGKRESVVGFSFRLPSDSASSYTAGISIDELLKYRVPPIPSVADDLFEDSIKCLKAMSAQSSHDEMDASDGEPIIRSIIRSDSRNDLTNFIPIDCWTDDKSQLLWRFSSVREAKQVLHLSEAQVREVKKCCLNRRATAVGFSWAFLDESFVPAAPLVDRNKLLSLRRPPLDSSADIGGSHHERPVYCLIKSSNEELYFPSICLAAKFFRIPKSAIVDCCVGARKVVRKMRWRFADIDSGAPLKAVRSRIAASDAKGSKGLSIKSKKSPPEVGDSCLNDDASSTDALSAVRGEPKKRLNHGKAGTAVDCWTLDGSQLLRRFKSIREALNFLGSRSRKGEINSCCLGGLDSAFGFKWKFRDDSISDPQTEVQRKEILALRAPLIGEEGGRESVSLHASANSPVDCWSEDGTQLLRRFASISELCDELNLVDSSGIIDCLSDKKKTFFGFSWKPADLTIAHDNRISVRNLLRMKRVHVQGQEPTCEKSNPTSISTESTPGNDILPNPASKKASTSIKGELKENADLIEVLRRPDTSFRQRVRIPVDCFSNDGKILLKRFQSIGNALIVLELSRRDVDRIRDCCLGSVTTAFGFRWRVYDDKLESCDETTIEELKLMRDPPIAMENCVKGRNVENDHVNSTTSIDCLSKNGEFLRRFCTVNEALRALRLRSGGADIRLCCVGNLNDAHGFKWQYGKYPLGNGVDQVSFSDLLLMREPPYVEAKPIKSHDAENRRMFANPGRGAIPVDCWDIDGTRMLRRFDTISQALKTLKVNRFADIKECIAGARESAFGFKWKYGDKSVTQDSENFTDDELLALRDPPITKESFPYRSENEDENPGLASVDCWDIEGNRLLRRFSTVAEACDRLHFKQVSEILDCCRGNKGTISFFLSKFN